MDELDDEMKLHAFLDGELSAEDAQMLERQIAASPALRDQLSAIQATQTLLREGMNAWAAPIPHESMWSAIEQQLAQPMQSTLQPDQCKQRPVLPKQVVPHTA